MNKVILKNQNCQNTSSMASLQPDGLAGLSEGLSTQPPDQKFGTVPLSTTAFWQYI
jgi:hypothetical protein